MAGRDVVDAFNNFVAPMNETLGCMTSGRLGIKGRLNGRIGRPSSVIFNRGQSLVLARNDLEPIHFGAMHRFRCIEVADDERGLVKIESIEYWHSFDVFRGNVLRELFSFHWTPELLEGEGINEPHLHLKTPMIHPDAPLSNKTFGKFHIPTGRVSLESIVRFAIVDLNVVPRTPNWDATLKRNEQTFSAYRTR